MTCRTPLIVLANNAQFARGQRMAFGCVRSRMLLWCRAGCGRVRVNAEAIEFRAGDVLLLPWRHAVAYEADNREPFFLAGIHVIPRQQPGTPLVRQVAHEPGALPQLEMRRQDAPWPGLDGLQRGHFDADDPLHALADYVVQRFQQESLAEQELRTLGGLLVDEMGRFFAQPRPPRHALSRELQRAVQFIDDHLQQPIYLEHAAQVANRSLSWLHRAFRESLGTTPTRYVIAARIRRARQLLAGSSLSVAEVGQAVGVGDPYYFSKLFKAHTGISPMLYRREASF